MTGLDLDAGDRYPDWKAFIDKGLAGCTCARVVVDLTRDAFGRVVDGQYNHTDPDCRAVAAIVAETVEKITDDPTHLPGPDDSL